ncbi:unnamed protein product [Diabrotica balteata]|uniref:Uncharacterized protein n=1 Tax=Diabrotica balteata TaxID=107213 RepID=A0A9N9TC99_DIABA|nr:unnamed protein product [Diabrotica balteata]
MTITIEDIPVDRTMVLVGMLVNGIMEIAEVEGMIITPETASVREDCVEEFIDKGADCGAVVSVSVGEDCTEEISKES